MLEVSQKTAVPSETNAADVEAVLGTLGLEGLSPSDDMLIWMKEYAAGTRTLDELHTALASKYDIR
jgi:hypothetical protein